MSCYSPRDFVAVDTKFSILHKANLRVYVEEISRCPRDFVAVDTKFSILHKATMFPRDRERLTP